MSRLRDTVCPIDPAIEEIDVNGDEYARAVTKERTTGPAALARFLGQEREIGPLGLPINRG